MAGDQLRYILDHAAIMGAHYQTDTLCVLKKSHHVRFGDDRTARPVQDSWDQSKLGEVLI